MAGGWRPGGALCAIQQVGRPVCRPVCRRLPRGLLKRQVRWARGIEGSVRAFLI